MKSKQQSSTLLTKEQALAGRKWFLLDATGKTLGRFATEVAKVLRGKHKANFTPNTDCGDGVIIIHAEKIKVTGSKRAQKVYRYHTGSIGGLREIPFEVVLDRNPDYIIRQAVRGMMPDSRLGKQQMKKLRIVAGKEHGMEAQQPISVKV